jgi:hypothetical protein
MGDLASPATTFSARLVVIFTLREKPPAPQLRLHVAPVTTSKTMQVDVVVLPLVVGYL